jgi:Amt family ammonium transporter
MAMVAPTSPIGFLVRLSLHAGLLVGVLIALAELAIGVATLLGFVFTLAFVTNLIIDIVVGQRVNAQAELEGLDIPEMGALCYPDFVLNRED